MKKAAEAQLIAAAEAWDREHATLRAEFADLRRRVESLEQVFRNVLTAREPTPRKATAKKATPRKAPARKAAK